MEHISNLDAHSGDQGLLKLEDNLNKMEPKDNHSESLSNVETDVVEKKDSVVQKVSSLSGVLFSGVTVTDPDDIMVDALAHGGITVTVTDPDGITVTDPKPDDIVVGALVHDADKCTDQDIEQIVQIVQDAVEKLRDNLNVITKLCGFNVKIEDNQILIAWNNQEVSQFLYNFVEEINQQFSPVFSNLRKLVNKSMLNTNLYYVIHRTLLYMSCETWHSDFLFFSAGEEEARKRDKKMFEDIFSKQDNEWRGAFDRVLLLQCHSLIDMFNINIGTMGKIIHNVWRLNEMLLPCVCWRSFIRRQESYVMSLHDLMNQADAIMLCLMRMMNGCFFPPGSLVFCKRGKIVVFLKK